jgi:hypothetical protein
MDKHCKNACQLREGHNSQWRCPDRPHIAWIQLTIPDLVQGSFQMMRCIEQ